MTGGKPFRGSTDNELLYQISSVDPCPPRELDDSIPGELERICLKALSKRTSDRYFTAAALADDLQYWQRGLQAEQYSPKVVPKGLRSFDANDADFFLELLPGPRDRDDLPESIRFWKTQIEERDADKTFSVGLILGPSGCGKSSLVKAGLLPRLSNSVLTIYVEATQVETEARVLRELRKRLPQLPSNLGLPEICGLVRRTSDKKVLLILDQFEQWLHAQGDISDSVLVSSLRQCDGENVQAIIMVRDDFSMAAARFMDALDIPILQGHNFATVDFFGVDHAQKVLTRFGQAFGKLPGKSTDISDSERDFVRQAALGLSQDGKVVSVRLSLFAEMVKDKTWNPRTLEEVGGTEGIGLNFLEESFSSRSANPQHRMHELAARKVLKALLPEIGSDIRGHMRSHADLLEASGYEQRPADFNLLLRILDGELRLITPTDVSSSQSTDSGDASSKFYQLTHDYLVPVLREWLTRKQRATPRGRAKLRLAERADIWNLKRERQQLPLAWEYLSILFLTSRKNRSEAEQRMMSAAARTYGFRWLAELAICLAIIGGFVMLRIRHIESQNLAKANALVDLLLVADISELPNVVASLEDQFDTVTPRLAMIADDIRRSSGERLRALLPLANRPGSRATQLIELVSGADAHTMIVVCDRLAPFANNIKRELWDAAHRDTSTDSSRLRLAALLAIADTAATDWAQFAPSVVEALLNETTLELDVWIDLLHPAAPALVDNLRDRFFSPAATPAERATAARVLAHYSNAALLSELLLKTDATHFPTLLSGTSRQQDEVIKAILASVNELKTSATDEQHTVALRLRNAAMTLLRLGQPNEAAPILGASEDPTARTMFMLQIRDFGATPAMLMNSFQECRDPATRQALLLSLEPYFARDLPPRTEQALLTFLEYVLRNNRCQSERSAAEWLLRRLKHEETIRTVNRDVAAARFSETALRDHEWWVTTDGHTMLVIRRPGEVPISSFEDKSNGDEATMTWQTLPYDFAISEHEVTMEQFRRFRADANFALDVADNPQCPANKVSFNDAIKYCEWLNDQEGIPAEERCYDPDAAIENALAALPTQKLMRSGYRLPTEVEWEFACRAKSTTTWVCGADSEYLTFFAWFNVNADRHLNPVGLLRPNPLGLFDVAGNVSEWCHTSADDQKLILRGGTYDEAARLLRSGRRQSQSPTGYSFTGFRIARTLPAKN